MCSTLSRATAADEIASSATTLLRLRDLGGIESLKEELRERASSAEKSNKNSWKSALYRAAKDDEEFCTSGLNFYRSRFHSIPAKNS